MTAEQVEWSSPAPTVFCDSSGLVDANHGNSLVMGLKRLFQEYPAFALH
jgi:hypothetical protein